MKAILEKIDGYRENMLSFLEKLVNIDSSIDNPEGIKQVAEIVGGKLTEIGFDVKYLNYPGYTTHVLARKSGKSDKNLMIIGHIDTVFSKGTAAKRPFTIRDEKAYGPGVLDMKGGITIALFSLQALAQQGWDKSNITVLFCGDEETGHPHSDAKDIFTKEAKGKDAVFNMETGAESGTVVVGRKGVIFPVINVEGKSAHAGKDPEKGASAILELAHKIIELYKINNKETGISFNPGIISGGTAPNAIAGEAQVKCDMRFMKLDQHEQILKDLKRIVNTTFVPGTKTTIIDEKRIRFMPMEMTKVNLDLYEIVRKQGLKIGIEVGKISVGGGSDSCWTTIVGAPTVCAMGARGELNHSEREYIIVDSLVERAKLLALSIQAV